jgi:hypothetical protein
MSKITNKQKSKTVKHIVNVYGITRHYGGPVQLVRLCHASRSEGLA